MRTRTRSARTHAERTRTHGHTRRTRTPTPTRRNTHMTHRRAAQALGTSLQMQRRSAADILCNLSHALVQGHAHGLEAYLPLKRLRPGEPLSLDPPALEDRPFLKIMVDESKVGTGACNFLFSHIRGFYDRDVCHRLSNDMTLAIKRSGLYGPGTWLLLPSRCFACALLCPPLP